MLTVFHKAMLSIGKLAQIAASEKTSAPAENMLDGMPFLTNKNTYQFLTISSSLP